MQAQDPQGYYAQLRVAHTASAAEIKQAFRRLALRLHPDRNTSAAAEEAFKQLIRAYEELRDPVKRAAYDAQCIDLPASDIWDRLAKVFAPIVCSVCGRVPVQPEYVIFYEVTSVILTTIRTPIQGIHCHTCADKRILRATVITWLFGWWGLPWGPWYTVQALVHNLLGDSRPADVNARLLGYQARYFASVGKMFLARSLATMALELSTDQDLLALLKPLLSPLEERRDRRPLTRLREAWKLRRNAYLIQSILLLGLPAAGVLLFAMGALLPQKSTLVTPQLQESVLPLRPSIPDQSPSLQLLHYPDVAPRLSVDPTLVQEHARLPTQAWYVTAAFLRLRAGPGIEHAVLGVLERFETVTVTGPSVGGHWLPVQTAQGLAGFVSRQYLSEGDGMTAKRQ